MLFHRTLPLSFVLFSSFSYALATHSVHKDEAKSSILIKYAEASVMKKAFTIVFNKHQFGHIKANIERKADRQFESQYLKIENSRNHSGNDKILISVRTTDGHYMVQRFDGEIKVLEAYYDSTTGERKWSTAFRMACAQNLDFVFKYNKYQELILEVKNTVKWTQKEKGFLYLEGDNFERRCQSFLSND